MAERQFKAESKRLLDLMANSIYAHREILLRELILSASDVVDKLAYKAFIDDQVGLNRSDFKITLTPDQLARALTTPDNGIGMTKEELGQNLGTIIRSGSLQFERELAKQESGGEHTTDIIGQLGVGFYSVFMVAGHVTVAFRAYGSDEAWQWASDGTSGYALTPYEKRSASTDIVFHIKQNTGDDHYDEYLEQHRLTDLIKKYSGYIHYPIIMLMHKPRQKPRPKDAGDDYKLEWEDFDEQETLSSVVSLWQRLKGEVAAEEYSQFYKEKYGNWEDPLSVVHVSAEGVVGCKTVPYIPAHTPYDFHFREYQKGLQLYSSGVLTMDRCADLLPEHFRFVEGVVSSQDLSLNISREMLQHIHQLRAITGNSEKKVKAKLPHLQKDDREKYKTFRKAFGTQVKVGAVDDYGTHKEFLKDLLLLFSSEEGKLTSPVEYRARMPEEQKYIYYACDKDAGQLVKPPQTEHIRDKGCEVLYLTDKPDQLVIDALDTVDEVAFESMGDVGALPEAGEEKATLEQKVEEGKPVPDFLRETLGDAIEEARVLKILKSGAACLTANGPITLEMEKYFQRVDPENTKSMKAQRVLELNPDSVAFAALSWVVESDRDEAVRYAKLLYAQTQLIAGLPLEDPTNYTELVYLLMN